MKTTRHHILAVGVVTLALTACGKDNSAVKEQAAKLSEDVSSEQISNVASNEANQSWEDADAILSDSSIPYPLYPNGTQYRIGGENGLKIILFQTEDSFEEVDAFYENKGTMPRLDAMEGYVRYSVNEEDQNPWETEKPGIVIHQFNNESERQAVGADNDAKTNIIMSFE